MRPRAAPCWPRSSPPPAAASSPPLCTTTGSPRRARPRHSPRPTSPRSRHPAALPEALSSDSPPVGAPAPRITVEHSAKGTLVHGTTRDDRSAAEALKANGTPLVAQPRGVVPAPQPHPRDPRSTRRRSPGGSRRPGRGRDPRRRPQAHRGREGHSEERTCRRPRRADERHRRQARSPSRGAPGRR